MLTNSVQPISSSNKSVAPSGLTEIVLPGNNEFTLVLPSLAFLTNQHSDRWLTWISHRPRIDRKLLQEFNFNLSRLRIIHAKSDSDAYRLMREALTEGNSHTVIGHPGLLSEDQSNRLEHSAQVGQCMGIVLRERRHVYH